MDLSFSFTGYQSRRQALPADVAILLVGIAARQAASPTAAVQARLVPNAPAPGGEKLLSPAHGAFNARVAASLQSWPPEVTRMFTVAL